MTSIVEFPARFAFTNTSDGTLTPEARRMLRGWFMRIGSNEGVSADDLAVMLAFVGPVEIQQADIQITQDYSAAISELQKQIEDLRQALAFTTQLPGKEDTYATIF